MNSEIEKKALAILNRRAKQQADTLEFFRMLGEHLSVVVCTGVRTKLAPGFDLRSLNPDLVNPSNQPLKSGRYGNKRIH